MSRQRRASRSFSPNPPQFMGFHSTHPLYTPLSSPLQEFLCHFSRARAFKYYDSLSFSGAARRFFAACVFRPFPLPHIVVPGIFAADEVRTLVRNILRIFQIYYKKFKKFLLHRLCLFPPRESVTIFREVISCPNWRLIRISCPIPTRRGFFPRTRF